MPGRPGRAHRWDRTSGRCPRCTRADVSEFGAQKERRLSLLHEMTIRDETATGDGSLRHPRTLGWVRTTALAMGGSNQSLFLLGALLLAQGSAADPAADRRAAAEPGAHAGVDRAAADVAQPGRRHRRRLRRGVPARTARVLANLAGTCYWWGWVPTCGLTSLLSAAALHSWYLPWVPVTPLAIAILLLFTGLNLLGDPAGRPGGGGHRRRCRLRWPSCPSWSRCSPGTVDWQQATSLRPRSPFDGVFGSVTSAMAGLYLIGFAAPAFEAAGCHVGETHRPEPQRAPGLLRQRRDGGAVLRRRCRWSGSACVGPHRPRGRHRRRRSGRRSPRCSAVRPGRRPSG